MDKRCNVFAIHAWEDAHSCRRLEQLLRMSHPDLAHYTVLPERALEGSEEEVLSSIESRINFATAVVVVNVQGLHRRPTATFEMETAVRLGKRIVVVQPSGDFRLPVPEELDGHVYRFAPWRSDVVGRAIRGEYPHDGRVFDLAEAADRRALAGTLAVGVSAMSFLLAAATIKKILLFKRELAVQGITLRWNSNDTQLIAKPMVQGALLGALLGALSGDPKTTLYAACAGAAVGSAVGVHRLYNAQLLGSGHIRVLSIEST